jgi:hypothetical protein
MKSKSWVIGLLSALVGTSLLGLGGYVALGPYRTMRAFSESLAARDSTGVAACVDFPKLRESLKVQLSEEINKRSKTVFAENPIASLAAGLATSLSDTLLDSLVTPTGLEKLLAGEQLVSGLGTSSSNHPVEFSRTLENASYSYESLSEFTVSFTPKPGVKITLILDRDGLDWKLAGVRLNESGS